MQLKLIRILYFHLTHSSLLFCWCSLQNQCR